MVDSVGGGGGGVGSGQGCGTGRGRTTCGHQNHRPSSAAMAGVMNERTIRVSNNRPSAIVLPTWPATIRSLTNIEAIVKADTAAGRIGA